jgi:hypothetical protein
MSRSAVAGGVVWIGIAAASGLHWTPLNTIELLFLLGPLVIVPLGLELCVRSAPEAGIKPFLRTAHLFQLPAAFCATASFWLKQGTGAAILVLPWLVFGCFIGFHGLKSLLRGEYTKLPTACMIVSFLYLPVGCAWLVASRLGLSPMGFQEPIVLLTAVHFHFAGFAAPLLALAAGVAVKKQTLVLQRAFKVLAAGVLGGPGLLAAGFVIGPHFKLAMALLVACSEVGLSLFSWRVFAACGRDWRKYSSQSRLHPYCSQWSSPVSGRLENFRSSLLCIWTKWPDSMALRMLSGSFSADLWDGRSWLITRYA